MSLKVAYMLGSLNRGGTETLVLDVFRRADYAPFDIIGIYRKGGAYKDDFEATNVPFMCIRPRKGSFISYLLRLRRALLENRVQVVHAQQYIDCLAAAVATVGLPIKVVETFHGYDFGASRLTKLLIGVSMRLADKVCFVSRAEKDYYLQAYRKADGKKYEVVYNGLDFSKFDISYAEPDCFKKIDSPQARFSVAAPTATTQAQPTYPKRLRMAMVGNFVSGRSQSITLRAIQLLWQRGIRQFDYYFVGRRDEKEPWRYDECVQYALANGLNNVHFLGGRHDVPAILQHIDGFVYSTDHDTFGIAVVEAMGCGLPVFVNDWDVMCEVLCLEPKQDVSHDVDNDLLWKSGDAESLERLLMDFLNDPEKYKKQARERQAMVRKKYAIETHIDNLSKVYSN